ncbi:integrase core domain-containing protein, partial [Pseudarthrobacter sp. CC4]|uniref:integrase core domain-containing protein n=1 Tax=Pseudarthrobacter sp. CC4 TaxID=3029190 RepID=UPI003B8D7D5F
HRAVLLATSGPINWPPVGRNKWPLTSGALKTETDVMEIVFEWVHRYNNERLHSALDHQTPEEYEQTYYDLQTGPLPDDAANKQAE